MPSLTVEDSNPGFDRGVANGSDKGQVANPGRPLPDGIPSYTVLETLLGDAGRRILLL